jgi:4-diphosphocytidyl-2-C-methyl-D-erythritol kinase
MSGKVIRLLSPAKINLYLKVTGKRKDGYHNIETLFQMIDLFDTMTFRRLEKPEIRVTCSMKNIGERDNLAYKAAKSLWKPGLGGIHIRIEKKIPSGAGLGGGSSNAATTLYLLNSLWQLGLSAKRLAEKGGSIGADVPFFLTSPRAWGTGKGNRLRPLPAAEPFYILLVKPKINVPTMSVYGQLSEQLTNRTRKIKILQWFSECVTYEETVSGLQNDLGGVVEEMYPVVKSIKRELTKYADKGVMVTGSGSTVFAIFKSITSARNAKRNFQSKPWWCALAKPLTGMKHLKPITVSQGGN